MPSDAAADTGDTAVDSDAAEAKRHRERSSFASIAQIRVGVEVVPTDVPPLQALAPCGAWTEHRVATPEIKRRFAAALADLRETSAISMSR